LDNRGVGNSYAPPGAFTTSQMALDAYELVDKALGWKYFHVVGLSMGGMIALELSYLLLDRLLSLTLLSTHAGGTIAPVEGVAHIMRNFRPNLPPDKYADFLIPILYSNKWLHEPFIDENGTQWPNMTNYDIVKQELIKARMEDPPEQFMGILGQGLAVLGHYISNERLKILRDSKIAVLIITGTKDKLVKSSNSFILNKALEAEQFIVLEGAGHMIHREMHQVVNNAMHQHFLLHNNRIRDMAAL